MKFILLLFLVSAVGIPCGLLVMTAPSGCFSIKTCHFRVANTQMAHFTDRVLEKLDNGMLTGAVFLDLSKVFGTVDHSLLLTKLKQIGVSDNVTGWFRSYLSNRFQLTAVGDVQSTLRPIQVGVPQGSILGPSQVPGTLETLRLRFFGISREPRTSRSHVTRALPSGLRFEVHVCTSRPRSRGK